MKTLTVKGVEPKIVLRKLGRLDKINATRLGGDIVMPTEESIKSMTAKQTADATLLQDIQVAFSVYEVDGKRTAPVTTLVEVFDRIAELGEDEDDWNKIVAAFGELNGLTQEDAETFPKE